MTFKIDMHVHTRHSGDNDADPMEMAREAIAKGLDGIAFTEHNHYGASQFTQGLKEHFTGRLRIFRGVEISTAQGHCLVYGVDTDPLELNGQSIHELAIRVRELGGVTVPSHPFRRGSGIGEKIISLGDIHAIEGYNGCNLHSMNMQAIDAAAALGLPFTGGSDAHAPGEVGSCYTEFSHAFSDDDFINTLKQGSYTGIDTRKISRHIWNI